MAVWHTIRNRGVGVIILHLLYYQVSYSSHTCGTDTRDREPFKSVHIFLPTQRRPTLLSHPTSSQNTNLPTALR